MRSIGRVGMSGAPTGFGDGVSARHLTPPP